MLPLRLDPSYLYHRKNLLKDPKLSKPSQLYYFIIVLSLGFSQLASSFLLEIFSLLFVGLIKQNKSIKLVN